MGTWRRAIEDFDAFIASQTDHYGALLLRGLAYHQLGANESAIADLSKAIELRPQDGATYIRRWQVYKAMGETAKAEADFATGRSLMENK